MDKYIEIFNDYVSKFEQSSKVILKKNHTLRVALNAYNIALSLKLDKNECELAYLIGLFHDLGRFKQIEKSNTFSDRESNINHAVCSIDILYKEGLINKFVDNTIYYDEVIKKAILNHNKEQIDDNLNDNELLFAKILRDADKIDILNVITFDSINDIFWFSGFEDIDVNPEILSAHLNQQLVKYDNIKSNIDLAVAFYNYAYDLNFTYTKNKILEEQYYEKITERFKNLFDSNEILDAILNKTLDYLKK